MTKRTKPVYVMFQEGALEFEKEAVLDGIAEMVELAGQAENIDVIDLGVWRNKAYKNEDGSLNPHKSIDWYIEQGQKTSRDGLQLDAHEIATDMLLGYYSKEGSELDGYTVIVVSDDMYGGETNFVVGSALNDIGTVISVNRFENLDKTTRRECIKTVAMHELGHVFKLPPDSRTENVEESLGKHCTNVCIMRQGLMVPIDDIRMSEDRLKYGALCETCKEDLKAYFRE